MFGLLRLPAPSQGKEHGDLVAGKLRVGRCQRTFRRGERAFGVQRGQKIGAAVAAQLACLPRRQCALVAGARQVRMAIKIACIHGQGSFGFAQRVQHRRIEACECGIAARLGLDDAAAGAAVHRASYRVTRTLRLCVGPDGTARSSG